MVNTLLMATSIGKAKEHKPIAWRGSPNSYVDSERGLRNWVKQQKKLLNAGALEGQRLMMFNELLGLGEKYKRVNQYQW